MPATSEIQVVHEDYKLILFATWHADYVYTAQTHKQGVTIHMDVYTYKLWPHIVILRT